MNTASSAASKLSKRAGEAAGRSNVAEFAAGIIRANVNGLSEAGTLGLVLSAVRGVDRDARREEFPRRMMQDLVQKMEKLEISRNNVSDYIQLTSQLCDDKVWRMGNVIGKLLSYFETCHSESGFLSPSDQVHLVKCVGNVSRVRELTVEQVEQYMHICLDLLKSRCGDLSGVELSNLLWTFVTLRRARNFTASNHYRKREANQLFTAELVGNVRDRMLQGGVLEKTPLFYLVQIGWAFATSGVWSFPLMNEVAERLKKEFDQATMRHVSNFIWACAIAGHRDEQLMHMIKAKYEHFTEEPVDAIIPWSLGIFEVEFDESQAAGLKEFPEKQDQTRPATTSAIHVEIGHKLENQGWTVQYEVELAKDLVVDMVIEKSEVKFAVEVDGPNHFITLCDGGKKSAGVSEHKARLVTLKTGGMKVINVDINKYKNCKPGQDRSKYLRSLLGAQKS